jgi:acetyl-CoA C-acetyltransferase
VKYFDRYRIDPDEGKRLLAKIIVKNHHNGSLNPKAHFQREVSEEDVIKSPIVAYPLGILDCCGVSDGAAAAVLTRADMARSFRDDPIYIKALSLCTGAYQHLRPDYDYTHVEENVRASKMAYEEAGIKNPRREISIAEVHDCFSIHEMLIYEDMGWSLRGQSREDIEAGTFSLGGQLPVNTDGGLKSFGHPLGASGLRMMYEVYKQLQGKAGPRQVKNARLGLTHNLGGVVPGASVAACSIVGNER